MTVSTDKTCPECGEEMITSKTYQYGHATADGFLCENDDCGVVHVDFYGDVTLE